MHHHIFNYDQIPTLTHTDVLVVGGGSAGCLAALTVGSQSSLSVTLIERYGFLGGTSTQMLDTFYGFFTPGDSPKKVVGGLPDRIVDALNDTGDMFLRPNTYGAGTGVNYNPERLKLVWDQQLERSGVQAFFHTHLVDVETVAENGISCICWHKSGFFRIVAKRVIDASGDADFCHLAGLDYEKAGEHEPAQSMTTTFRMAAVDLQKFEAAGGKKMLKAKMKAAVESGRHPLPRKEGSAHEMVQKGCIATVAVKVPDLYPLLLEDVTKAEKVGRQQAFIFEKFFREEVPGYEEAKIIGLSHHIGVRETRRVYGEARLTKADCLSGNVPEDSVLLCGAPIEDHRQSATGATETYWEYIPNGGVYGVPYGTLVPKGSELVWVVGRCFSATHDAHASCRSMGQTMSMGQAAGIAAIQSIQNAEAANSLSVQQLRNYLHSLGSVLEIPGREADISRYGWSNQSKE